MNNYFRITGYSPENDFCFIVDSYGMFEKLWQFSAFLVSKGLEIIEVSKEENIIDINITKSNVDNNYLQLKAIANGKPEYVEQTINGVTYNAIKVSNKMYIANNE